MKQRTHFWSWTWRILAGVCLVLTYLNLRLEFESGSEPGPSPADAVAEVAAPAAPLQPAANETLPVPRTLASPARTPSTPPPSRPSRRKGRQAIQPVAASAAAHEAPVYLPTTSSSSAQRAGTASAGQPASASPGTMTLKPLGYVERADGSVEAVVEEGGWVRVVRVGETFAEGYRVASISPSAVELLEDSPPPPAPAEVAPQPVFARGGDSLLAAAGPVPAGVVPSSAAARPKPGQVLDAALRATAGGPAPEAPTPDVPAGSAALLAASLSQGVAQISPPEVANPLPEAVVTTVKPLGYVEWVGGRVQAVMPEGDSVRLIRVGDTYDECYQVVQIHPFAVEIVDKALRPARPAPFPETDREAEAAPVAPILVAATARSEAGSRGNLDGEASGPGAIGPSVGRSPPLEAAARSGPKTASPRLSEIPVNASVAGEFSASNQAVTGGDEEWPRPPPTATGFSRRLSPAPDGNRVSAPATIRVRLPYRDGIAPGIESLGYVERADGAVLAIVSLEGRIRLIPIQEAPEDSPNVLALARSEPPIGRSGPKADRRGPPGSHPALRSGLSGEAQTGRPPPEPTLAAEQAGAGGCLVAGLCEGQTSSSMTVRAQR